MKDYKEGYNEAFRGKEALIQGTDLIKPSIDTPLGTIELSLAVSANFIFLVTVLSSNMADHSTNITTTRLIAS